MSRRTYIVEDKHTGGFGLFVLFLVASAYSKEILIVGLIMFATWFIMKLISDYQQTKSMRMVEEAPKYWSDTDPLYGDYPPVTMPLTYPICNTYPYRSQL